MPAPASPSRTPIRSAQRRSRWHTARFHRHAEVQPCQRRKRSSGRAEISARARLPPPRPASSCARRSTIFARESTARGRPSSDCNRIVEGATRRRRSRRAEEGEDFRSDTHASEEGSRSREEVAEEAVGRTFAWREQGPEAREHEGGIEEGARVTREARGQGTHEGRPIGERQEGGTHPGSQ